MEHLALGWVLLLAGASVGARPAGSVLRQRDLDVIEEVPMDMALSSFDDQYWGCRNRMEAELKELNRTEFANNRVYAENWRRAAVIWRKQQRNAAHPQVLTRDQAIAVLAYTLKSSLHCQFNAATREGGSSSEHYLRSFHFKTLHFLLSQALQRLRESQPPSPRCHHVYRGVRDVRFTARRHQTVRFGHFASTSLQKKVAQRFGQGTFFEVETCYGVPIKHFSNFSRENEVLIPPFETFNVTSIARNGGGTRIQLRSQGTYSKYNCELVKGEG
ncbi:NRT2 ribosyltransferase, partial [Alectura lathami]|nr:NRT2 ribosyltransferase [Alectura lathami]